MTDNLFEELFHACALEAFLLVASRNRRSPDSEATKWLAYKLYEAALAEKNQGV